MLKYSSQSERYLTNCPKILFRGLHRRREKFSKKKIDMPQRQQFKKNKKKNQMLLKGNQSEFEEEEVENPDQYIAKARKESQEKQILRIHILSNEKECESVIASLSKEKYVGFDCEGYLDLSRNGKVALIQLSTNTDSYIFDIFKMCNRIPCCLRDFLEKKPDFKKGEFFKCPIKIIHDCRKDQDALYHVYGIRLNGIFDTSVAYLTRRVVGFGQFTSRLPGLGLLLERNLPPNCIELTILYPSQINEIKDLDTKAQKPNENEDIKTQEATKSEEQADEKCQINESTINTTAITTAAITTDTTTTATTATATTTTATAATATAATATATTATAATATATTATATTATTTIKKTQGYLYLYSFL
ncbi:hypothetical protein RFI_08925 [Reticulomyxa filosa]|uniref:3'-5' exonuclease domain-containing protein n=1 Tax=Reticulomyxa filosa TaxID=46433 RepID=X6NQL3_RETFI|nr:hypothetical protein RFI_08925 [Reticulomyxa filosa]|eukprot:ETO28208.1 hypothetical protein RFI_08925 [Reticulomyxa filosa]